MVADIYLGQNVLHPAGFSQGLACFGVDMRPPADLPLSQARTNHLSFTRRSYIFLRTQQSPAGAGLFNGFEINAQADSLSYLE